jgi:hypothetical protein
MQWMDRPLNSLSLSPREFHVFDALKKALKISMFWPDKDNTATVVQLMLNINILGSVKIMWLSLQPTITRVISMFPRTEVTFSFPRKMPDDAEKNITKILDDDGFFDEFIRIASISKTRMD